MQNRARAARSVTSWRFRLALAAWWAFSAMVALSGCGVELGSFADYLNNNNSSSTVITTGNNSSTTVNNNNNSTFANNNNTFANNNNSLGNNNN